MNSQESIDWTVQNCMKDWAWLESLLTHSESNGSTQVGLREAAGDGIWVVEFEFDVVEALAVDSVRVTAVLRTKDR